MDPILITVIGLSGMILLIGLHVPIGVALSVAGFVGYGLLEGFHPALTILESAPTQTLSSADLVIIPLFLAMGGLANSAGLSRDIYNLIYVLLGHRKGGLALATIAGCAGFGAVCGSSPATAVTMGRVALPEMLKRGYTPSLAAGSVAAGGTLGMLIPPSIVMVIYAFIAQEFVIDLFTAALIPAAIAVAFHFIAIMITVRLKPSVATVGERSTWPERLAALRQSWGVILLMGTVIGGLYSGIFTVHEAAALGLALSFLFALLRGRLNRQELWMLLKETAGNTAMIYTIIIGASIFSYFITATRIPQYFVETMNALDVAPLVIILLLLVMYLILGAVFDTVSSMLITLPFVLPMVVSLGYDPIWWGVVLIMVTEIGMITPPIGMNVFIIHGVAPDISLRTIFRGILPFFYADLLRVLVVVLFPALALWLPQVLG
ncbi:MAG: TRAP transporter large permease [Pseudomonadota bacterium]|nr:TRAP transporter large permease [Pseudomonadota bacterium]MEE2859678.1 TRAP transporter large permease [Pseudomonadota bacterium]